MKKILQSAFLLALSFGGLKTNAQVSIYAFNQLSGTYNTIAPGSPSSTIIAMGSQDDNTYGSLPIGFNFLFNGSTYSTFGLNVNGWISLGSTTPFSSYNPISSGSANDAISAFARDLQLGPYQSCNVTSGSNVITFTYPAAANLFNVGDTISGTGIPLNASVTAISAPNMTISSPATSNGTTIYAKGYILYALTGVSPNQVLTVQWKNCGRWSAGSTGLNDFMNFQIKLYETTNIVEVVYGTTGTNNTGTATMEVGLRGASNADFNNRSVPSGGSWAASTAGAVNSASGFFSSTTSPSSGQIYRWSPPAGCAGTPASNSVVSNASVVCSSSTVNLSLANSYTSTGLAYQWYASPTGSAGSYTAVSGATSSTYAPVVNANSFYMAVITCTNGSASTTATPVQVNVGGNGCQCNSYCSSNATSTADDEIFNVTLGTLNNTSNCSQTGGPGSIINQYSNYTGMLAAPTISTGTTYTMGITVGQCSGFSYSGGVVVYMDFNQNGLFTDPGEMVYSSPLTTFSIAGTPMVANVSVPLTASLGVTRMRVIAVESTTGQVPCGTFSWGETEDYCINIVPLPPCSAANGGTITNTSINACANQTLALSSNSVSTGTGMVYQWMVSSTPGGSYTAVTGGTGSSTPSYTTAALSPAVYYYVLQATCTSASLTAISNEATVTVNPNPTLAVTPSSVAICFPGGSSVPLSASGASTYTWIPAAGLTATTGANVNALPGGTTVYTVNGTSSAGCSGAGTTTVYISEGPSVLSISASPSVVCSSSGNSSLTALGGLTSSYTITNIPYAAIPVPSTGVTTLCNNGTASIPLTQGSLDDGQWANMPIPFNFNFFGAGYSSFAVGTNGFIWLGAGNPNTYFGYNTILPSASSVRPLIGTVYADLDFDGVGSNSSIKYFVTGTSPNQKLVVNWTGQFYPNTGTVTTQAIVYETSNIIEVHTFTSTANQSAAEGIQNAAGTTAYIVPGRNAVTWAVATPDGYRWSPDGGPLTYNWTPGTFLSSTTIPNPVANNVTSSTSYSVLITSPNGCSTTATLNLNVSPAPVISSVASPTSLCGSSGSVALTASGAATYSWSTGATSSSVAVTPTASTVYSVAGTNSAGCVGTATVAVAVGNSPTVNITAGTGTVCAGGATGLTANGATSYTWDNGSNAQAIGVTPSVTTTYSVTGNNGGGCTGTATISIFVNSLPTVNLVASQTTVCVNGSTVSLTGSPSGGVYTGSNVSGNVFTPGSSSGTFTAGYNVTSTITGCSNSAFATIVVSTCTGLDKLQGNTGGVKVYPNPNTGVFTIELNNDIAKMFELCDLTGRVILREKTSADKMEVNISNFANGIYFVKVQTQNGVEIIKVIKQ